MSEKTPPTGEVLGFIVPYQTDLSPLNAPKLSLVIESDEESPQTFPIHKLETEIDVAEFAGEHESQQLQAYARKKIKEIFAPIRKSESVGKVGLMAVISTILSGILVFLIWLNGILIRGWRLEIVRKVGLNHTSYVPSLHLMDIFNYLKKGLVLMVMRGIYFFPHFFFIWLNSQSYYVKLKDIIFWIWEKALGREEQSFLEYLMVEVFPEFTVDLVMQFVILVLYMIIVWPIYRITMIKYALGSIRGYQFLSPSVLRDSAHIYRTAAADVLGIYFFTFMVDFFITITSVLIRPVLLFLGGFILPTYKLIFRHWPKGYAYGILAQKLIAKGLIKIPPPSNMTNPTVSPVSTTDNPTTA